MKFRYLLPIIYIIVFGLSFILPSLFGIFAFFSEAIINIIILAISVSVNYHGDTYILTFILTITQFFLIGYGVDKFLQWARKPVEKNIV